MVDVAQPIPANKGQGLRVIGLGCGRTGTGSLKVALNKLGYKTFHMSELPKDLDRLHTAWMGIYEKVDKGTVARKDWDDLYSDYTATLDFPGAMFPRELLAAYPDAKFILTTRDPVKWKTSTEETIFRVSTFPVLQLSRLLRPQQRKIKDISARIWKVFFRNRFMKDGAEIFQKHNELCRALVPQDQLLNFQVTDGWEPLCKFLDVPVPDEPFPYENEGKEMKKSFDAWEKILLKEFATYYVTPTVGFIALAAVISFNRNKLGGMANIIRSWWGS